MTGFALGFLSLSLKKESGEVVTCVAWLVALAWVAAAGAPWLAKNFARARAEGGQVVGVEGGPSRRGEVLGLEVVGDASAWCVVVKLMV
jgi:hypothetical protein